MITIKYKGVEANCTTVDEAIELIKKLDLDNITIQPNVPNPYYPDMPADPITPIIQPWPDCDKCPNKPKIGTTIGDTPCNWCKKNLPYCSGTISGTTRIKDTEGVIKENDIKETR